MLSAYPLLVRCAFLPLLRVRSVWHLHVFSSLRGFIHVGSATRSTGILCNLWGERQSKMDDHSYLTGGYKEDQERLSTEVRSNMRRGNGHKQEHGKFQLDIGNIFFKPQGRYILEQVAQRWYGNCVFRGIQASAGRGPEQPNLMGIEEGEQKSLPLEIIPWFVVVA